LWSPGTDDEVAQEPGVDPPRITVHENMGARVVRKRAIALRRKSCWRRRGCTPLDQGWRLLVRRDCDLGRLRAHGSALRPRSRTKATRARSNAQESNTAVSSPARWPARIWPALVERAGPAGPAAQWGGKVSRECASPGWSGIRRVRRSRFCARPPRSRPTALAERPDDRARSRMAWIRSVARPGLNEHDMDDIAADHRALLADVARHDHRHHVRDDARRMRAVSWPCRPGLAAPWRGIAEFVALERRWRQPAGQWVLLPPLGAPPVDRMTADVLEITDHEGAAARRERHPDDEHGVGGDGAGQVRDRRARRVGAGH